MYNRTETRPGHTPPVSLGSHHVQLNVADNQISESATRVWTHTHTHTGWTSVQDMHAGCCVSEHRRLIVRYEVYLSHVDQSIRAPRELFQRYVWGCVCEFLQSLSVFFMSLLFLLSWVIYSRLLVRDRSPRPTLLFPNSANALLPLKGIKAKLLHSFENIDTSLVSVCMQRWS